MVLDVTAEQDFLRSTTARFLDQHASPAELRRLRDDPIGYAGDFWPDGAALGWVSLLVSEDQGGGTISGRGLADLALIAHEFGRHSAPGPFVPSNVVAFALSGAGGGAHAHVLGELVGGRRTATWCYSEPVPAKAFEVSTEARPEGDAIVLNGVKAPVESADNADHFLVTCRTGSGITQVLVGKATPGVSVEPMKSVDLTRRFGLVRFDNARVPASQVVGAAGGAAAQVERQLEVALALTNAESVGAMEAAFEMTVQWAFDRYTFGRPLASYQALKHRFADMKSWFEAAHAISDAAAAATEAGSGDASELASIAKSFVGEYSTELVQDCVQIHGGIGVTFEHDLHLYVRRVTLNRGLYGTPADHRQRLAEFLTRRRSA